MPEGLEEGLHIALMGMGLVFISLVVFLLILLALQKLFPGEEIASGDGTDGGKDRVSPVLGDVNTTKTDEPVREELGQMPLEPNIPTSHGILGPRVAALAVALYITLENGLDGAEPPGTVPNPWDTSRIYSEWGALGRASLWNSQGHRPEAYGQRIQSPYTLRGRLRE